MAFKDRVLTYIRFIGTPLFFVLFFLADTGFWFAGIVGRHLKTFLPRVKRLKRKSISAGKSFFRKCRKRIIEVRAVLRKRKNYQLRLSIVHEFAIFIRTRKLLILRIKTFTKTLTRQLPTQKRNVKVRLPVFRMPGRRSARGIAFKIVLSFSIAVTFFGFSASFFWFGVIKDLPAAEALSERALDVSTRIYDRDGNLLYSLYKDKNRTLVKLSDVPVHVQLATLAAEDADFYNHSGISPKGIARATLKFLKERKVTGGSTITQQLVKNALLSPDKTVARKLREVLIAIAVEQKYSKDEILEMYLNEVSYGGTAYGIQEAARQYFAKEVYELTLSEAALLAGLPKSPSTLSPFGPNPDRAYARQQEVLRLMEEAGFISAAQVERASSSLIFAPYQVSIRAPHFVMYVREILAQMYGEEFVYKNGLEVTTTLDGDIQSLAEAAVADEINDLSHLRVGNGAAVVLKPKTGEILAMVGSKDYFNLEEDGNVNVVLQKRQPGSAIKVVNYAYALAHGYSPTTIIEDVPTTFNVPGQEPYSPKNYDNTYRGRITLRSALAESRNVPAVRVLAGFGVSSMIETGRSMGITSWEDPKNYGLSLTLGGGDITLYELATVYATIANYGKRPEMSAIAKITDASGRVLYEHTPKEYEAIDPRISYILTDILRDNTARAPAFGSRSALVVPGHPEVAVKTGTSNNLRDNLTVGYNQDYLVAVWVGNNDNAPMSRVASGITGASPIWNRIMSALLADSEPTAWSAPEGLVRAEVCGQRDWYLSEMRPEADCLAYPESSEESNRPPLRRGGPRRRAEG